MPTARELLQQADALMRRNRARQVDTEIPELTEAIAMPVAAPRPAPPPMPLALDDIPELTDAVEEIEIASIVELPEDDIETSGWPRSVHGDAGGHDAMPDTTGASQGARPIEPIGGRVLPLFAIAATPAVETSGAFPTPMQNVPEPVPIDDPAVAMAAVDDLPVPSATPDDAATAAPAGVVEAAVTGTTQSDENVESMADVIDLPVRDAIPVEDVAIANDPPSAATDADADAENSHRAKAPAPDDWARWEALAEEVRMQVLQRVDIFTDTGLREQLSIQMQPIVDRASAELIATINAQVGTLLRAYIAEAIEREIDKWRTGNT